MIQKYTEAKKKANKKWDEANKERKTYINRRSNARGFIKNLATLDDLEELKQLIHDREQQLKNNE